MKRRQHRVSYALPREVTAAIDSALSDLERTVPGASKDPHLRSKIERAVAAALSTMNRTVQATHGETKRLLEGPEMGSAVAGVAEASATATRKAMQKLARYGVE